MRELQAGDATRIGPTRSWPTRHRRYGAGLWGLIQSYLAKDPEDHPPAPQVLTYLQALGVDAHSAPDTWLPEAVTTMLPAHRPPPAPCPPPRRPARPRRLPRPLPPRPIPLPRRLAPGGHPLAARAPAARHGRPRTTAEPRIDLRVLTLRRTPQAWSRGSDRGRRRGLPAGRRHGGNRARACPRRLPRHPSDRPAGHGHPLDPALRRRARVIGRRHPRRYRPHRRDRAHDRRDPRRGGPAEFRR